MVLNFQPRRRREPARSFPQSAKSRLELAASRFGFAGSAGGAGVNRWCLRSKLRAISRVSPCRLFRCFRTTREEASPSLLSSSAGARMKASSAPVLKLAGFAEARQAQPLAVTRPPLRVLRASQGGDDDDCSPGVGELPEIVHRRIDGPAAVAVLAWSTHPLDVVEQDQAGVEGVGRECHVRQVKRRANEGEPVGDASPGLPCRARSRRRARP